MIKYFPRIFWGFVYLIIGYAISVGFVDSVKEHSPIWVRVILFAGVLIAVYNARANFRGDNE